MGNTSSVVNDNELVAALKTYYRENATIKLPVFEQEQSIEKSYIHLALVDHESHREKEKKSLEQANMQSSWQGIDFARIRTYEDAYKITQTPINLKYIFHQSNRLIVLGRAGIGKSTFCKFVASQWAAEEKDKKLWSQFQGLYWIPLRHLRTYRIEDKQILTPHDVAAFIHYVFHEEYIFRKTNELMDRITIKAIAKQLKDKKQRILLLLDGYDEVEHLLNEGQSNQRTMMGKLVDELMKQAYLLTSRPYAIRHSTEREEFRTSPEHYYELMGFSDENIPRYVDNVFRLNKKSLEASADLIQFVRKNPSVWGIAHVPINLALICALWDPKAFKSYPNVTLSILYGELIKKLQMRYLEYQYQVDTTKYTAKEIDQLCVPVMDFLGKLAFQGLLQDSLLFDDQIIQPLIETYQEKLTTYLHEIHQRAKTKKETINSIQTSFNILDPIVKAGFLNTIQDKKGAYRLYYFLHSTFQEYFAAYYLSKWFKKEIKTSIKINGETFKAGRKFIKKFCRDSRFEIVFWFLSAFLQPHQLKLQQYFDLLMPNKVFGKSFLRQFKENIEKNQLNKPQVYLGFLILRCWEESNITEIKQEKSLLCTYQMLGARVLLSTERDNVYYRSVIYYFRLSPQVLQKSKLLEYLGNLRGKSLEENEKYSTAAALALRLLSAEDVIRDLINSIKDSKLLERVRSFSDLKSIKLHSEIKSLCLLVDRNNQTEINGAVNVLENCVSHDNAIIRLYAAEALAQLSSAKGIEALIKCLRCKNREVEQQAIKALIALEQTQLLIQLNELDVVSHQALAIYFNVDASKVKRYVKEKINCKFVGDSTYDYEYGYNYDKNNRELFPELVKEKEVVVDKKIYKLLIANHLSPKNSQVYNDMLIVVREDPEIILICFSLISYYTFKTAKIKLGDLYNACHMINREIPRLLLIGVHEKSISERKVRYEEAEQLAEDYEIEYFEIENSFDAREIGVEEKIYEKAVRTIVSVRKVKELTENITDQLKNIINSKEDSSNRIDELSVQALINLLKSSATDKQLQKLAAKILTGLGKKDTPQLILFDIQEEFKKGNFEEALEELKKLEENPEVMEEVFSFYVKSLKNPNSRVWQQAFTSLQRLEKANTSEVIAILISNLNHPEKGNRREAKEVLEQLTQIAAEEVIKAIKSYISSLTSIEIEKITPDMRIFLINNLSHEREGIQYEVAEILKFLEAVPQIAAEEVIKAIKSYISNVRSIKTIMPEIVDILVSMLISILPDERENVWSEAGETLKQLEQIQPEKIIKTIEFYMSNKQFRGNVRRLRGRNVLSYEEFEELKKKSEQIASKEVIIVPIRIINVYISNPSHPKWLLENRDALEGTLLCAAYHGHLQMVKYFVEEAQALIQAKDNIGDTALSLAAWQGHIDVVSYLKEHGGNINHKQKTDGRTPLMAAAIHGQTETVKWLLENGGELEAKNDRNMTALMIAARHGYTATVQYLYSMGANLFCQNSDGFTALQCAAANNRQETVNYLLSVGANKQVEQDPQYTLLHWVVAYEDELEKIAVILLRKVVPQALLHQADREGNTPLHHAAGFGTVDTVRLLLEQTDVKNDIELGNQRGFTPLHLAVIRDNSQDIVELLLKYGAEVTSVDKEGNTPLHKAVYYNIPRSVKSLLAAGANIYSKNHAGKTPLDLAQLAQVVNDIKILQLFSEQEKTPKSETTSQFFEGDLDNTNPNSSSFPKLMFSASYQQQSTIPLQQRLSENISKSSLATSPGTVTNSASAAAFIQAVKDVEIDSLQELLQQGVNVNVRDVFQTTALHWAALKGNVKMIQFLLKAGADLRVKDVNRETPMDWAKQGENAEEVVKLLQEHDSTKEEIKSISENVQQTVSRKPPAINIPIVPSALSRKGLSDKGKLSHPQLIKMLPQDKTWDFGKAIDNGDCFYDAIVQALHARAMKHAIKSLRNICSDHIYQLNEQSPEVNWVKEAIEKDKGIDDYQAHLATVQYTQEEMAKLKQESNVFSGYAIWGKPHIEGKILAQRLDVSLHIIEFHEAGSGMEAVEPTHILVTKDKVSQVEKESINYQDEQMIHLAVYRNHFVPILPSRYLKQQQSNPEDNSQEMTQFNKHSRISKIEDENKLLGNTSAEENKLEEKEGNQQFSP